MTRADGAISVKELFCARGGLPVLQNLSFSLATGRALVLRGPNGIGKTTLLRCLAGLQPVLAGAVEVEEDSLVYAGHADGVKPMLSVHENLTFWARIYGGGDVEAAIRALTLTGLEDRFAQNLSAGQRRRLGLARLLVAQRPLWLLDEPTVSLDKSTVAVFGAVLRAHLDKGGAAIIATHIDIGLDAETLDLSDFKANTLQMDAFSEVFV